MPQYSLDGDTSGLPKTQLTGGAYEIEPLTVREAWGAGNGAATIVCRQGARYSPQWITEMVGKVFVIAPSSALILTRDVPERYLGGGMNDDRVLYCTGIGQINSGDLPDTGNGNFSDPMTSWPMTKWRRFNATFEALPYAVQSDSYCDSVVAAASPHGGARELCRYIIRNRRVYSKEQPVPAGAAGFKDVTTGKKIGQVGFRVVGYADVTYKWIRVPLGWPPPVGWTGFSFGAAWPPPVGLSIDVTKRRTRDTYLNTVNDNWFDVASPDGYAWPPGTLLYTGFDDSNRYFDAAGKWVCDVTYNFKAKMALDSSGNYGGWNYALNASGQWVYINLEGSLLSSDTPPYVRTNFNNLFQYS